MGDCAVRIVYDVSLRDDCNCKCKLVVVTCTAFFLEITVREKCDVLPFATSHCLPPIVVCPPLPTENPQGATRQGKLGEEVPWISAGWISMSLYTMLAKETWRFTNSRNFVFLFTWLR